MEGKSGNSLNALFSSMMEKEERKEINLLKYKVEVLTKILALQKDAQDVEAVKTIEALKRTVVKMQDQIDSLQTDLAHMHRNRGLDFQELNLRGALGRVLQEFEGARREALLRAFARLGPDGEYIVERMSRQQFMDVLRLHTELLTAADLQCLSLRFSDGIDILVRDFVMFVRDAHLSPAFVARLDPSLKELLDSMGIAPERTDAEVQTTALSRAALITLGADMVLTPATRTSSLTGEIKSTGARSKAEMDMQDSLLGFDKIRRRREGLGIDDSPANYLSHRSRGLDVHTSTHSSGMRARPLDNKFTHKPKPVKKLSKIEQRWKDSPEEFIIILLKHAVVGHGDDIDNGGLERAIKEAVPSAHAMDAVSVQLAVADSFKSGRCPIKAVVKYLSKGEVTEIAKPHVLQQRANQRAEKMRAMAALLEKERRDRGEVDQDSAATGTPAIARSMSEVGSSSSSTAKKRGILRSVAKVTGKILKIKTSISQSIRTAHPNRNPIPYL